MIEIENNDNIFMLVNTLLVIISFRFLQEHVRGTEKENIGVFFISSHFPDLWIKQVRIFKVTYFTLVY